MRKAKKVLTNLFLLSATSIVIQTIGVFFQIYISNRIGPSGVGLFQLVMTVYLLAVTLSTSGVKFTSTRLVSEEQGLGSRRGADKAVTCCIRYGLLFSVCAAALLFTQAGLVGTRLLGDPRTAPSLRILAVSLPFVSVSAVLGGYFMATRNVFRCSCVQIVAHLLKIAVTVVCLTLFPDSGMEHACMSIVIGMCFAECFSCCMLLILYLREKTAPAPGVPQPPMIRRMLNIALPLALSSYARAGLSSVENLLTPYGLRRSGASAEQSLAIYGMIGGMVLPVIMFPSVILNVLSELLVPELSESAVCGRRDYIDAIVSRVLQIGLIFSAGVMGVMYHFSADLGQALYHSAEASYYIRVLSPLVLMGYMDTLVDGMLKGLGEQVSSMRYNIIDSFISVLLIYTLLPRFAINGYLITIVATTLINFFLSFHKLLRITHFRIGVLHLLKTCFCVVSAIVITDAGTLLLRRLYPGFSPSVALEILCVLALYLVHLYAFSNSSRDNIRWFFRIFRRTA